MRETAAAGTVVARRVRAGSKFPLNLAGRVAAWLGCRGVRFPELGVLAESGAVAFGSDERVSGGTAASPLPLSGYRSGAPPFHGRAPGYASSNGSGANV